MFGKAPRPPETQPQPDGPGNNQLADMALDTVAGILRNLAEFALEQEGVELQTFRANAEAWAKHVTLATAPPGAADDDPKARKGRREWEAVRRFVRDYCQGSCARTVTMTADLRQVIWVFIRNITGRPRAVSRQAGWPRPRTLRVVLAAGRDIGNSAHAGRTAGRGHTTCTGIARRSQHSVARASVGRLLLARAEISHLGQAIRRVAFTGQAVGARAIGQRAAGLSVAD